MLILKLTHNQAEMILTKEEMTFDQYEYVPKFLTKLVDRRLYTSFQNPEKPGLIFSLTERGREVRTLLKDLQYQELIQL